MSWQIADGFLKNSKLYYNEIWSKCGYKLSKFAGYYADDLSMAQEIRGNYTVRVKNESRGFHLNNLSYAGPIVMGVGGM